MAPRGEKSQLKRSRAQGIIPDDESDIKRPRRSSRLASGSAPEKSAVSHQQQLPSPVTHLDTFSSSDLARDLVRDPAATPLVGNGKFPPPASQDLGVLSSPPEPTQPFGQSQAQDPQAAIEAVIHDEVKEGVWGYLYPLDSRYKTHVLKKRSACPPPRAQSAPKGKQKGSSSGDDKLSPCKGVPSGGYLIGRHPECDIIVDDQIVSNRHCLIFAENKDEQPIAVLEDMSSNGTFVNDAIVGRNQRRELKEHDEIAILRDVRFVFKYPKSRKSSPFQEQYEVLQKLGKGHFAEVYMCVERSSGQRYAVKVFEKRGGPENKSRTSGLQQEIAVLMGVNHPNVLCLKDTFDEPDGVRLILELAPEGELFNFIIRKQKLTESETRKLFLQLFNGVKYLHERNIVHRDIKPENILLVDDDLHVKLADFGLAKIIGDESFTTTLCGTPSYVAPEILAEQGRRKYTKAVDIWSLGVVLYICLCGFPPFSEELTSRQYPYSMSQQIREGRFDYPSPYWDSVGDPALDLIDRMLVVDPSVRYDIDQCLEHPWTQAEPVTNPNDSTGLIGGLQGLDVGKRRVARERTLLARMNSIHMERVPDTENKRTIAVFNKNKHRVMNMANPQPRPADDRRPGDFMQMGGVGDPVLFDEAEGSVYAKADIADGKTAAPSDKKQDGR